MSAEPCPKCFNTFGVMAPMLETGPEFCDEDQRRVDLYCPTCGYRERND